jgi:hypothetical protein
MKSDWSKKSPKRGKQRLSLKKKCGVHCFLRPKDNGFPICDSKCNVNCQGLLAAKKRASQYGYEDIKRKAQVIAVKNKCEWALNKSVRKPKKNIKTSNKSVRKPKKSIRKTPIKKSRKPKKNIARKTLTKSVRKPKKSIGRKIPAKSVRKPKKNIKTPTKSVRKPKKSIRKTPIKKSRKPKKNIVKKTSVKNVRK